MACVYRGHKPKHLGTGQSNLPPLYESNVPGSSPHSLDALFPPILEYTPWQRSAVLPPEYPVDVPPPWARARPVNSRVKDPHTYYTPTARPTYDHPPPPISSSTYYTPQPSKPFPEYSAQTKTYHVHPLLDGTIQNSTLTFNLASPNYCPAIVAGLGNWSRIPDHELRQPAIWPPIHRLRILCKSMPEWPVDIEPDPSYYSGRHPSHIPPVQLGDVLWSIWNNMRTTITQSDWASSPADEQEAVSKAFRNRYRHYGNSEKEKGVLRIDYTLGKGWFKGLTRVGIPEQDSDSVFEMHVV